MLGLLGGLITLIRPTNIVVLVILFLWNVVSWADIKERVRLFISKWYWTGTIALFFFIIWIPQFLYWKFISGQYLYYSYDASSHFDFFSPHIIKGLFSYRKGWLLYTPIMIFSLLGIIVLYKKHKTWFMPIGSYTILNIYIVLSWYCWWYGGSYGLRAFIDSYSILALPLAAFTAWALKKKPVIRYSYLIVFIFLIALSIFQTAQYRNGAIFYDHMTKKSYWETFGKLRPTADFYKYLDVPPK
jgi:hypothetical protein